VAAALVVYTAFYLAIVGAAHLMGSPDASAAIAPAHVAATIAAVAPPTAAGESPATRFSDSATGAADNSRECTAAIDSGCIYN